MKDVFNLLRPHQWLKNVFVFLPLFFNGQFGNISLLAMCIVAFVAFSFAASSIYCFNDIWDIDADRMHSKKRHRPLASGALSVRTGYVLMVVMLVASLAVVFLFAGDNVWEMIAVIVFYYIMNIDYCIWLKYKTLVDVFVIATGFVLRVLMGGVATGVELSHWIVMMTFLLALFLAFAKRRDDVVIYESTGVRVRRSIGHYNLTFMDLSITIVATVTLVAYVMYTISPEIVARFDSPFIYATSVFVLLGILRYLQLTIVDVKSGSPTKTFMTDRFLWGCIAGWVIMFVVLIYM